MRKLKAFALFGLLCAFVLTVSMLTSQQGLESIAQRVLAHVWPEMGRRLEYRIIGVAKSNEYAAQTLRPSELAKRYRADGPYYGYGNTRYHKTSGRILVDEEGFPKVRYGDQFHYNPVTVAQFALAEYSRDGGPSSKFLRTIEKLLSMQDVRGAFLYPFKFRKYAHGEDYEPGWNSGMAQGQALSAIGRAYHLTRDMRYLKAGNAALSFMQVAREDGGPFTTLADLDGSLAAHPFIMEYPATPSVYTLNGFMFAVQGLYDWSVLADSREADVLFRKTLETLIILLPYYDLGTFSSYDLSYITLPVLPNGQRRKPHINAAYHAVHIEQLWALHAISTHPNLKDAADRWERYVKKP